jgi:hypothetical protein
MATKTKKPTKKPTKYHYIFFYNRGNYFDISHALEDFYEPYFCGSGCGGSGFDVHFYCTAKEYKRIVAFARRNYGKIKSVIRYTDEAFKGDN